MLFQKKTRIYFAKAVLDYRYKCGGGKRQIAYDVQTGLELHE